MHKFYLLSLGRSGHHAVMNWICEQSRPSCYFNNCDIENYQIFAREVFKYIHTIDRKYNVHGLDVNEVLEGVGLHIYNFIGITISELYEKLGRSDIKVIVVVRDPYNFITSRMMYGGGLKEKTRSIIPVWKSLVSSCLYMDQVEDDTTFIPINFNNWFVSEEYRKEIAGCLGIEFTDKGLNFTGHMGKSVFEKDKDTRTGQDLDVLNRFKSIATHKILDLLDSEAVDLAEKYFNMKKIR